MKKHAVFILALFLVTGTTSRTTSVHTQYHSVPEFTLSDIEMPVYELITPEVNASYTSLQALSLFNMRGAELEEYEGIHIASLNNMTFEIDSSDASIWYADYSRLWNLSLGIEVQTPDDCRGIADAWLDSHSMLPEGVVFENVGACEATAHNPDSGDTRSKILHYQVNYGFQLNDVPVVGPGAQIAVIVGEGGDVIALDWNWREVELHMMMPVIEYESILEMYSLPAGDVLSHSLSYYAGPDSEHDGFLYPVYEIVTATSEEDPENQAVLKIPATQFSPSVAITSPSDGAAFSPDEDIIFNCSVVNGTAPYTFTWSSVFQGQLSDSGYHITNYAHGGGHTGRLNEEQPELNDYIDTVMVEVIDANGLVSFDFIEIQIGGPEPPSDTTLILVIAGIAVLIILILGLTSKKKGRLWSLMFLLIFLAGFCLLPIVAANESEGIAIEQKDPSGDYDDGVKEIGIEWVGLSHPTPLPNTKENIEGFYNWMHVFGGYNKEFNWGEYSAWEQDFKHTGFGGDDSDWVDCVDFVYYQDHGGPNGFDFTSSNDDHALVYTEARWGDGDLEWLVLDACSPLAWENGNNVNVWERWAPALQGLHLLLSFSTTSNNVRTRGWRFGMYSTGFMFIDKMSLVDAWFRACAETEGSSRFAAVLYASKSADPFNPQLDDPINDHAHGFGYQCSDPVPGTFSWYVYITSQC